MLAADAELDVGTRRAPFGHRHRHQLPDPVDVDLLERAHRQQLRLEVRGHQAAFYVVAGESERHLREVVRAEREKLGDVRDLSRVESGARCLDHRADRVVEVDAGGGEHLGRDLAHPLVEHRELGPVDDQRDHDLDARVAAGLLAFGRGLDEGPNLHAIQPGLEDSEPAPAGAEHRVRLGERLDPPAHPRVTRLLERRQELVQRRVEEADRHRQPGHGLEDALEVGLLERQQPVERIATPGLVGCEDHLLHDGQPLLAEEHVLGAAEPDALRAELAGLRRVVGVVGVRAHLEPAQVVGPLEDRLEILVDRRRDERNLADDHATGAAVDSDHVALAQVVPAEADGLRTGVDVQAVAAGHARFAHAARDHGRVRRHPAVCGEDALRLDQPVDVVGRRLPADEDHRLAGLAVLLGAVGVEDDLPGSGARRGVEALRGDLELGVRVEARMQELVELARVDPRHRLLPLDEPFRRHVDRALDRRRRRPLRGARLEEVEVALLDGELDVLHVAVVALERAHRLEELVVRVRHVLAQLGERLRRAGPGDDVLSLRVDEVLAVDALLAGRGVAGEADAGRRVVAFVPEDHLDDVDRRAEVVGDRVHAPVDLCA